MPEVRAGQLRLHYEAAGEGVGVVLVHELGGSTETWANLQPRLVGAGLRVVALDLRGAGRSDVPAAGYGLTDLADDVLRVMDAANLSKAFLVGLAVGGLIALQCAHERPGRVLGLVLIDTPLAIPESTAAFTRQRADIVVREGMAAVVDQSLSRSFPPPVAAACPPALSWYRARFLRNDPRGYALASLAFLGTDFREAASRIDVPALVLVGEHDVLFPPAQARLLAEALPRATYHVIAGAGHFPPLQVPDALANLVVPFLVGGAAGGSRRG
jgi:3-oxoadipate enol-lactonase